MERTPEVYLKLWLNIRESKTGAYIVKGCFFSSSLIPLSFYNFRWFSCCSIWCKHLCMFVYAYYSCNILKEAKFVCIAHVFSTTIRITPLIVARSRNDFNLWVLSIFSSEFLCDKVVNSMVSFFFFFFKVMRWCESVDVSDFQLYRVVVYVFSFPSHFQNQERKLNKSSICF